MVKNEEGDSTRGGKPAKTKRIQCWNCQKVFRTNVDGPCPSCGSLNRLRYKESLGYRILIAILWMDVAFTIGIVIFLLAGG